MNTLLMLLKCNFKWVLDHENSSVNVKKGNEQEQ